MGGSSEGGSVEQQEPSVIVTALTGWEAAKNPPNEDLPGSAPRGATHGLASRRCGPRRSADSESEPLRLENFITTIYHPNISSTDGAVCLDLLKCRWSPSLSIGKVLAAIHFLMCNRNPDDPLECVVAAEYKNNREQYIPTAKLWTAAFAKE
ncbi:hypothetical protein HPB50_018094 [Hyalomma asiaticum]|uniref:Uncharacterized protein n=1 Tax=Hyalomma asiaticum TaxID=266040 RepID=A0ACB7SRR7_HYAAI|nr:hypothetical protein HPB50_018094 [Hyalomma asiaticum]